MDIKCNDPSDQNDRSQILVRAKWTTVAVGTSDHCSKYELFRNSAYSAKPELCAAWSQGARSVLHAGIAYNTDLAPCDFFSCNFSPKLRTNYAINDFHYQKRLSECEKHVSEVIREE
ncbi:hypothetical protein EVAR_44460_1 [Eumeta japonica]|uniref:Uncharacterized protein n=1 Tax=Eumeta variegata TaxID=151549 RepID=A0A4C1WMY7_EUMVA|nr:hypothetical protein EVAR_44460_1 [Eumeta japonica]